MRDLRQKAATDEFRGRDNEARGELQGDRIAESAVLALPGNDRDAHLLVTRAENEAVDGRVIVGIPEHRRRAIETLELESRLHALELNSGKQS
jgi:hypothetical protein